MELLLAHGANVDEEVTSKCVLTPLHLAIRHGDIEIAAALLDRRAIKDAIGNDGSTFFHLAAINNCKEVA